MDVNNKTAIIGLKFTGLSTSNPQASGSRVVIRTDRDATHGESANTDSVGLLGETCPVPVMVRRGRNVHRRRCHQPHGSFHRLITRFSRSQPSSDSVLVLRTKRRPSCAGRWSQRAAKIRRKCPWATTAIGPLRTDYRSIAASARRPTSSTDSPLKMSWVQTDQSGMVSRVSSVVIPS